MRSGIPIDRISASSRSPAVLRLCRPEGLPEDADEGLLGLSLAHDEDRGHSVGLPPSTFIFQRSPIE